MHNNLILKLHPLTEYDIKDDRVIIDKTFNTYEDALTYLDGLLTAPSGQ